MSAALGVRQKRSIQYACRLISRRTASHDAGPIFERHTSTLRTRICRRKNIRTTATRPGNTRSAKWIFQPLCHSLELFARSRLQRKPGIPGHPARDGCAADVPEIKLADPVPSKRGRLTTFGKQGLTKCRGDPSRVPLAVRALRKRSGMF